MRVSQHVIRDSFMILPSIHFCFADLGPQSRILDLVTTFSYRNLAKVYLTRFGGIGFRFSSDGPLHSIVRLDTMDAGIVPDQIMENHDEVLELQSRRIAFANFVAATISGRLCALSHRALTGAHYAGLADIIHFQVSDSMLLIENTEHVQAILEPKLRAMQLKPNQLRIASGDQLNEAVGFLSHLSEREGAFQHADLQTCMVMNYQAAILHSEQHSAASFALNFVITEALINEIFFAYGLVGNIEPRDFARRSHACEVISKRRFKEMKLKERVAVLAAGRLVDAYLIQRIEQARGLRNDLMHKGIAVGIRDAGQLQTVVRDLWRYLLDHDFELISAWSMRYQ